MTIGFFRCDEKRSENCIMIAMKMETDGSATKTQIKSLEEGNGFGDENVSASSPVPNGYMATSYWLHCLTDTPLTQVRPSAFLWRKRYSAMATMKVKHWLLATLYNGYIGFLRYIQSAGRMRDGRIIVAARFAFSFRSSFKPPRLEMDILSLYILNLISCLPSSATQMQIESVRNGIPGLHSYRDTIFKRH